MKVGLDTGYRATKAIASNGTLRRVMFLSVTGTPDRARFALDEGHDIIIENRDEVFMVGEGAVRQSHFLDHHEDRAWIKTPLYYHLFLAALSEITTATSVQVEMVTGLPVAFYSDAEEQRAIFLGEHVFRREGRPTQRVHVTRCVSIPQPFGTLFSVAMSDQGKFINSSYFGRTGIIDIGGKTTNILSTQGASEISRETVGVNVGGWDVVHRTREYLNRRYPELTLRDHEIEQAVRAREVAYFGQLIDLTAVIDSMTADLAGQIVGEATKLWGAGAQLEKILISGGGALLLGEAFTKRFRQAEIVPDPVYANALGYWRFANRE